MIGARYGKASVSYMEKSNWLGSPLWKRGSLRSTKDKILTLIFLEKYF